MGDVFVALLKAAGLLAELGRSGRAGGGPRAASGPRAARPRPQLDTYEVPIQNEEAVLGLTWTGGVVELRDEEETADVEYIVPRTARCTGWTPG